MIISVPVYIEHVNGIYSLSPLFFDDLVYSHKDLGRGTAQFANKLREILNVLALDDDHTKLSEYTFCPDVIEHNVKFSLLLKKGTLKLRVFLVVFRFFNRRIAFSPRFRDIWFAIERGQKVESRAEDVFLHYFKQLERDDPEFEPEDYSFDGKAWTSVLDIDFTIRKNRFHTSTEETGLAALGSGQALDGETELRRVGRCLDWLYPDDIQRAFLRSRQVSELTESLAEHKPRPTLLIGKSKVGKTSIIHEIVYRSVKARGNDFTDRKRYWLLSPQRLIAGMSYVGQWEQRLLAILKYAKRKRHILYFDDLLGLFRAGISANSTLSVGQMIKPFIERREFALVAEITPEAFSVLKEVDRGFADLFHLLPVKEPADDDILLILIRLIRQLEGKHQCIFAPDALPKVIELQRRYARHLCFPGKAAVFLDRLAVKYKKQNITAEDVLQEFHDKSGISRTFLDDNVTLRWRDIVGELNAKVIGQHQATEALADIVTISKAKLHDPNRPLGSCLFLGPTGVGKTEAAKAIASYLLGDENKLIRFDMNEFSGFDSVGRLVGTFDHPFGQLTTVIAQNPFSVLLLDEIEKAHPSVFDLFLQVLDDGRLTDAKGQTVDFTGVLIVMTSNLGAEQAGHSIGFEDTSVGDTQVYLKAAENFFRPEFFNRLDRIVPFAKLDRQTIHEIAEKTLSSVLLREGLKRRKCLLDIHPEVTLSMAERGFDPKLGARALKRTIERHIARPAASKLSSLDPEHPTVVTIAPDFRSDQFDIHIQTLKQVEETGLYPKEIDFNNTKNLIDKIEGFCISLDEKLQEFKPNSSIKPEDFSVMHRISFDLGDQIKKILQSVQEFREYEEAPDAQSFHNVSFKGRTRLSKTLLQERWGSSSTFWSTQVSAIFAALDVRDFLREVYRQAQPIGLNIKDYLLSYIRRLSMISEVIKAGPDQPIQKALLFKMALGTCSVYSLGSAVYDWPLFDDSLPIEVMSLEKTSDYSHKYWQGPLMPILKINDKHSTHRTFRSEWGYCLYQGPIVDKILQQRQGTHLIWNSDGSYCIVSTEIIPIDDDFTYQQIAENWIQKKTAQKHQYFEPIVRFYDDEKIIDVKTGLIISDSGLNQERETYLLQTHWPISEELKES